MKVLLIGKGAREHALCWTLNKDPKVTDIFAYPGNPGTNNLSKCSNFKLDKTFSDSNNKEEWQHLALWSKANDIDLCLVGPEAPLNDGIVDIFQMHDIAIFGPSQKAAQLECSKAFAKKIMSKANIPTAQYTEVSDFETANKALNHFKAPFVLKYDGLAGGKGVRICQSIEDAQVYCKDIFIDNCFKTDHPKLIIEEFLDGEELSYFALCKGENFVFLGDAQDHKRLLDNDKGPNTGGMGAYSPTQIMSVELKQHIESDILKPLLKTMQSENTPYTGFMYLGLMVHNNKAQVIEFNVRLGDPEAQCLISRISKQSSLAQTCLDLLNNKTSELTLSSDKAFVVTLAAENYPQKPITGKPIHIHSDNNEHTHVFHAGTKLSSNDQLLSDGGRVLSVCSVAKTHQEAADLSYGFIKDHIEYDRFQMRHDIGKSVLK